MRRAKIQTESDFWDRMRRTESGCWEWQGAHDPWGYGNLGVAGVFKKAHRYAYELAVGPIPDGMDVCHRCDNPPCCNPDHLWLGTERQRSHDARTKGRLKSQPPTGEASPHAKLTADQVREILELWASGDYRQRDLAGRFGVSEGAISKVVTGRKWKHLHDQ
jgi:hypothetical protein